LPNWYEQPETSILGVIAENNGEEERVTTDGVALREKIMASRGFLFDPEMVLGSKILDDNYLNEVRSIKPPTDVVNPGSKGAMEE
jgi:hypothetical protein